MTLDCAVGVMHGREDETDCRALARTALDIQRPARLFNEALDHGQSKACALTQCLCGEERLGRASDHFVVHAGALISDGDLNPEVTILLALAPVSGRDGNCTA